ncbi:MAG: flippase activity-associated protein Agl23 [Dehalococcoidia bacterium]
MIARLRWPSIPQGRARWELAALVLLVLLAAGLRLWGLGDRAIHHDESIHIRLSYDLAQSGNWSYSPAYHGPFQYMMNAAVFRVLWDGDYTGRLGYALFGTALVALPFLLRRYLGGVGTWAIALMLALSPTMLYFSRFARNDILMAFWALALVVCLWRYIDEGRDRYLYLIAALLALAFATKETAYIMTATFGLVLFLLALPELVPLVLRRLSLSQLSGPAVLLVLLVSLTLPLWSAVTAFFQGPLGIVLASPVAPEKAVDLVGVPEGTGLYVALGIGIFALMLSLALGLRWNWKVWLRCAGIFWVIWATLYTDFFTDLAGLFTGSWQGMGYWLAQQGVARGGQPWYYYVVMGLNYEFLAVLFALPALAIYLRRGEGFGLFLVLWAAITFGFYSVAAERMPWLLVNLALPFILLAGRFIGELVEELPWREMVARGRAILVLWAPLLVVMGVLLLYRYVKAEPFGWQEWSLLALLVLLLGSTITVMRLASWRWGLALWGLGTAALLLGFGTFVALRASYGTIDETKEMLVYAGIGQGVATTRDRLGELARETGKGQQLEVTVDTFSWPWWWYLRHYTAVGYPNYSSSGGSPPMEPLQADMVLLDQGNQTRVAPYLASFTQGETYNHLLWFPQTYRDLGRKFGRAVRQRESWQQLLDYFLFRELRSPWDSTKTVVYYADHLEQQAASP